MKKKGKGSAGQSSSQAEVQFTKLSMYNGLGKMDARRGRIVAQQFRRASGRETSVDRHQKGSENGFGLPSTLNPVPLQSPFLTKGMNSEVFGTASTTHAHGTGGSGGVGDNREKTESIYTAYPKDVSMLVKQMVHWVALSCVLYSTEPEHSSSLSTGSIGRNGPSSPPAGAFTAEALDALHDRQAPGWEAYLRKKSQVCTANDLATVAGGARGGNGTGSSPLRRLGGGSPPRRNQFQQREGSGGEDKEGGGSPGRSQVWSVSAVVMNERERLEREKPLYGYRSFALCCDLPCLPDGGLMWPAPSSSTVIPNLAHPAYASRLPSAPSNSQYGLLVPLEVPAAPLNMGGGDLPPYDAVAVPRPAAGDKFTPLDPPVSLPVGVAASSGPHFILSEGWAPCLPDPPPAGPLPSGSLPSNLLSILAPVPPAGPGTAWDRERWKSSGDGVPKDAGALLKTGAQQIVPGLFTGASASLSSFALTSSPHTNMNGAAAASTAAGAFRPVSVSNCISGPPCAHFGLASPTGGAHTGASTMGASGSLTAIVHTQNQNSNPTPPQQNNNAAGEVQFQTPGWFVSPLDCPALPMPQQFPFYFIAQHTQSNHQTSTALNLRYSNRLAFNGANTHSPPQRTTQHRNLRPSSQRPQSPMGPPSQHGQVQPRTVGLLTPSSSNTKPDNKTGTSPSPPKHLPSYSSSSQAAAAAVPSPSRELRAALRVSEKLSPSSSSSPERHQKDRQQQQKEESGFAGWKRLSPPREREGSDEQPKSLLDSSDLHTASVRRFEQLSLDPVGSPNPNPGKLSPVLSRPLFQALSKNAAAADASSNQPQTQKQQEGNSGGNSPDKNGQIRQPGFPIHLPVPLPAFSSEAPPPSTNGRGAQGVRGLYTRLAAPWREATARATSAFSADRGGEREEEEPMRGEEEEGPFLKETLDNFTITPSEDSSGSQGNRERERGSDREQAGGHQNEVTETGGRPNPLENPSITSSRKPCGKETDRERDKMRSRQQSHDDPTAQLHSPAAKKTETAPLSGSKAFSHLLPDNFESEREDLPVSPTKEGTRPISLNTAVRENEKDKKGNEKTSTEITHNTPTPASPKRSPPKESPPSKSTSLLKEITLTLEGLPKTSTPPLDRKSEGPVITPAAAATRKSATAAGSPQLPSSPASPGLSSPPHQQRANKSSPSSGLHASSLLSSSPPKRRADVATAEALRREAAVAQAENRERGIDGGPSGKASGPAPVSCSPSNSSSSPSSAAPSWTFPGGQQKKLIAERMEIILEEEKREGANRKAHTGGRIMRSTLEPARTETDSETERDIGTYASLFSARRSPPRPSRGSVSTQPHTLPEDAVEGNSGGGRRRKQVFAEDHANLRRQQESETEDHRATNERQREKERPSRPFCVPSGDSFLFAAKNPSLEVSISPSRQKESGGKDKEQTTTPSPLNAHSGLTVETHQTALERHSQRDAAGMAPGDGRRDADSSRKHKAKTEPGETRVAEKEKPSTKLPLLPEPLRMNSNGGNGNKTTTGMDTQRSHKRKDKEGGGRRSARGGGGGKSSARSRHRRRKSRRPKSASKAKRSSTGNENSIKGRQESSREDGGEHSGVSAAASSEPEGDEPREERLNGEDNMEGDANSRVSALPFGERFRAAARRNRLSASYLSLDFSAEKERENERERLSAERDKGKVAPFLQMNGASPSPPFNSSMNIGSFAERERESQRDPRSLNNSGGGSRPASIRLDPLPDREREREGGAIFKVKDKKVDGERHRGRSKEESRKQNSTKDHEHITDSLQASTPPPHLDPQPSSPFQSSKQRERDSQRRPQEPSHTASRIIRAAERDERGAALPESSSLQNKTPTSGVPVFSADSTPPPPQLSSGVSGRSASRDTVPFPPRTVEEEALTSRQAQRRRMGISPSSSNPNAVSGQRGPPYLLADLDMESDMEIDDIISDTDRSDIIAAASRTAQQTQTHTSATLHTDLEKNTNRQREPAASHFRPSFLSETLSPTAKQNAASSSTGLPGRHESGPEKKERKVEQKEEKENPVSRSEQDGLKDRDPNSSNRSRPTLDLPFPPHTSTHDGASPSTALRPQQQPVSKESHVKKQGGEIKRTVFIEISQVTNQESDKRKAQKQRDREKEEELRVQRQQEKEKERERDQKTNTTGQQAVEHRAARDFFSSPIPPPPAAQQRELQTPAAPSKPCKAAKDSEQPTANTVTHPDGKGKSVSSSSSSKAPAAASPHTHLSAEGAAAAPQEGAAAVSSVFEGKTGKQSTSLTDLVGVSASACGGLPSSLVRSPNSTFLSPWTHRNEEHEITTLDDASKTAQGLFQESPVHPQADHFSANPSSRSPARSRPPKGDKERGASSGGGGGGGSRPGARSRKTVRRQGSFKGAAASSSASLLSSSPSMSPAAPNAPALSPAELRQIISDFERRAQLAQKGAAALSSLRNSRTAGGSSSSSAGFLAQQQQQQQERTGGAESDATTLLSERQRGEREARVTGVRDDLPNAGGHSHSVAASLLVAGGSNHVIDSKLPLTKGIGLDSKAVSDVLRGGRSNAGRSFHDPLGGPSSEGIEIECPAAIRERGGREERVEFSDSSERDFGGLPGEGRRNGSGLSSDGIMGASKANNHFAGKQRMKDSSAELPASAVNSPRAIAHQGRKQSGGGNSKRQPAGSNNLSGDVSPSYSRGGGTGHGGGKGRNDSRKHHKRSDKRDSKKTKKRGTSQKR
uniref:Uncharacterized protein n=1 Tax=Chromera velia CCMP2878 TaxID=1169474 RepID=A0A0G4IBE8_9ALVE|eukprot:Cvel_12847.t1-p1 / transcript=Cvel_12847.t1 / gene=Cvel_12847 / organism=Chromera_velia_CCMP2878 / gene_product=hypothetical protein / transcript_product=hypothetical protein / location=Cvel_scaffold857:23830-33395(-) / protein_length=2702 / sequence_SO=supercontig / SO=protein_coding / is_pseudo=false